MWFVIGLIWLLLIAGIFWSYKKKRRQRDAESARKMSALLAELRLNPDPAASTAPGVDTQIREAVLEPALVREFGRKARLLSQSEALLYFVFRTGLPDHEIFANLTLADVIEIAPAVRGYEREQRARKLTQQRLDFVVCTKQLAVIAVVLCGKHRVADGMTSDNARFVEACLQSAGIRLVCIDPGALPRHHQVREMVYGIAR
jgi:hypothetical protein